MAFFCNFEKNTVPPSAQYVPLPSFPGLQGQYLLVCPHHSKELYKQSFILSYLDAFVNIKLKKNYHSHSLF